MRPAEYALGQIPFPFAGSGGPDVHNRWAFRRFVVLDPAKWIITPTTQGGGSSGARRRRIIARIGKI